MTVEVCPICDIAGCKHIRERTHPMTHDTPPKRIWMTHEDHGASWSGAYRAFRCSDLDHSNDDGPNPEYPEYTLTSEAEAMVAAALRGAAAHGDAWIAVFGDVEIKHTPANAYAADAVLDYQDAILALIPQPASAALDKLIAEAVAAERAIWTQAIETYFDATAVQDVEQHVAALRALPSATQAGGWMPPEDRRVKPLVFSEFMEGGCIGRPHQFQYFITQSHDGRFLCHWDETWHETLLAAQEHAQIDYQSAAFAPLPPAPEGAD